MLSFKKVIQQRHFVVNVLILAFDISLQDQICFVELAL